MGAEVNILHDITESPGAVDMAALGFILKESTGHRPTQPNFQKCPHYLTPSATLSIKNCSKILESLLVAAKLSAN